MLNVYIATAVIGHALSVPYIVICLVPRPTHETRKLHCYRQTAPLVTVMVSFPDRDLGTRLVTTCQGGNTMSSFSTKVMHVMRA